MVFVEEFEKVKPLPAKDYVRVSHYELKRFVSEVFIKLDVPVSDAKIVADNLVSADLKGIESHGVARLKRYIDGILNGVVKTKPKIRIIREGPVHVLVDGDYGLGQVVAYKVMQKIIEKAEKNFFGVAAVKKSNHFGIAGYYAELALKKDFIGVAMTNSRPLVAHTGALGRSIGTNPLAFAAPTRKEPPFLLDMATSIVPMGKIETYSRKGEKTPQGLAIDEEGKVTTDPGTIMEKGALLPLGGLGEKLGGHKGYGLSVMIDVLSGVLSGANWGLKVGPTQGPKPSNVGHFFAALNIEAFMPLNEFKDRMEQFKEELKSAKLHPEFERIWVHGEKSWLTRKTREKIGVPVYKKTMKVLKEVSEIVGVEFPF